jgi:hypothetical protein
MNQKATASVQWLFSLHKGANNNLFFSGILVKLLDIFVVARHLVIN